MFLLGLFYDGWLSVWRLGTKELDSFAISNSNRFLTKFSCSCSLMWLTREFIIKTHHIAHLHYNVFPRSRHMSSFTCLPSRVTPSHKATSLITISCALNTSWVGTASTECLFQFHRPSGTNQPPTLRLPFPYSFSFSTLFKNFFHYLLGLLASHLRHYITAITSFYNRNLLVIQRVLVHGN